MQLRSVLSDLPFVNEINSDNNLKTDTVIETVSFDTKDYAYMTLLSQLFSSSYTQQLMKGTDRKMLIDLIKQRPELDELVDKIEQCILKSDSQKINKLTMDFLRQLVVSNTNKFTKEFTKKFIKTLKGL